MADHIVVEEDDFYGSHPPTQTVVLAPGTGITLTDTNFTEANGLLAKRITIDASGGGGSGNVATDTIFDAKGDLPVGTGPDTADNLPVGADGTVLTADSTQTMGMKWDNPLAAPMELDDAISVTLAGSQNDWAPTGFATASIVVVDAASASGITITGLAGGSAGRLVLLVNQMTLNGITLAHQSTSSSAANRFMLRGSANDTLRPGGAVLLYYDAENSVNRWKIVSESAGVANDTIWDAIGDLAVGGQNNDTASVLNSPQDLGYRLSPIGPTFGLEWRPHVIRKPADETVNNSNTPQNDDDLKFDIIAGEAFFFTLHLAVTSVSTTSDFLSGWTVPANVTMRWSSVVSAAGTSSFFNQGAANSPNAFLTDSQTQVAGGANLTYGIYLMGWVYSTTGAGTVNYKWSQNTATVENTKVLKDSLMLLWKVHS